MAPITKLWAVRDPTPGSTLADILFELDLTGKFLDYVLGGALIHKQDARRFWEQEHTTLYFGYGEAQADALGRLAKVSEKVA